MYTIHICMCPFLMWLGMHTHRTTFTGNTELTEVWSGSVGVSNTSTPRLQTVTIPSCSAQYSPEQFINVMDRET